MSIFLHALERHAALDPDREAIRGTYRTLSWRQLWSETGRLAAVLGRGATVGLHINNSPAWVAADLAAMAAGLTHVPLPCFFSDSQLRHALRDARIDTVITEEPWRIASLAGFAAEAEVMIADDKFSMLRRRRGPEGTGSGGPAKITYTSGTTGQPRGVRLRAGAIERVAGSLLPATGASPEDRALVVLPLSILLENIGSVLAPILAGARIIVPDPSELGIYGSSRVDPPLFAAALNKYRPTTMILPPQLLKLLVGIARQGGLPDSFRFIAVGSAPTGAALLDAARGLGLPVYQGYGLSEACSVVALNSPGADRCGSVGKPLPHARVRVDESGRIFVAGVTFDGYLGDAIPEQDAEVDTGDLGALDEEGYLYVRGRSRNRIVTGFGRNISPEWIEAELAASDRIASATVFLEHEDVLAAELVPAADATAAELGRAVGEANERLPDYARIGRFVIATWRADRRSGAAASASGHACGASGSA